MAALDFSYNAEINGKVQYFDVNGKMVVEHQMQELYDWADKEYDFPSARFIDDNWITISTEFYNSKCKDGFKSGNNTYPYAKEGIYNITPANKSK